jgi:hypothetical protein
MISTAQYIGMWTKVQVGVITVKEWQTFCVAYAAQVVTTSK